MCINILAGIEDFLFLVVGGSLFPCCEVLHQLRKIIMEFAINDFHTLN